MHENNREGVYAVTAGGRAGRTRTRCVMRGGGENRCESGLPPLVSRGRMYGSFSTRYQVFYVNKTTVVIQGEEIN